MRFKVISYASCPMNGAEPGGQRSVPCKLNNAKTNKHLGQFIMDCLRHSCTNKQTANENS